jgi:cyanate permease
MSSVFILGATLGSATVFAVARPLVGPLAGGWRPFFRLTGAFVVGYAAVWLLLSRALWARVDRVPEASDQSFSLASIRRDLAGVVTHYGLLLLVVVGTMRLFVTHGLSNWLPTILEARGMTPALAGTVTSLFILVRVVGIVAVPAVSDRFSTRRLPIVGCGLAGAAGLAVLTTAREMPAVLVSLALVGTFAIGGLAPLVRAIPIEMDGIGPHLTAVANGLIFTVGEVGGFAGPFSVGAMRDLTGSFAPALGVLAVACLVVSATGYYMDEPSGSSPDPGSGTDAGS